MVQVPRHQGRDGDPDERELNRSFAEAEILDEPRRINDNVTMKRSLFIPYAISAILAVSLIASLSHNQDLRERINSGSDSSPKLRSTSRSDETAGRSVRESGDRTSTRKARSISDILANPDPLERTAQLLAYVKSLAPDEIEGALKEVRTTTPYWDPDGKMLAHLLLTRWAKTDPEAALASLANVDLKKQGDAPISVLSAVASDDPERARAWLEDPENAMARYPWIGQFLAGAVAKEWVRTDPDAALAWAAGLPDSQQAGAYSGVLGSLAMTDPADAARRALALQDNGARSHILGEIAEVWAARDPAAASAWAMSLEGSAREATMGKVLGTMAQTDPAGAARRVGEMGKSGGSYVLPVVESWSQQDPRAAAAWTLQQPANDNSGRALGTALWHWTTREPEAASQWLADQPANPVLDGGIAGLSKAAMGIDPGAATQWANSISDPALRETMVNGSLGAWRKADPGAANRWAETNLPTTK